MVPNADPYRKGERRLMHFGFNTPFEVVSIALMLHQNNIRVVYPRAIYEVGEPTKTTDSLVDSRRYLRYLDKLSPDCCPAFSLDRSYIMLWGFYNGSDEQLAQRDGDFLESVDVQDLNLHGSHLLLSLTSSGKLLRSGDGCPDVRICNFEFLKQK
jgi:hypothetical protein